MTSTLTFDAQLCAVRPTEHRSGYGVTSCGLTVDVDLSQRQTLNLIAAAAATLPMEMRGELVRQLQEEIA